MNTTTNALTAAEVLTMRDKCVAGLIARGIQTRVDLMMKASHAYCLSETAAQHAINLGVTREQFAAVFTGQTNPTKPARASQFLNGLALGLTGVDMGTLRGILALRSVKSLGNDALGAALKGTLKGAREGIDAPNMRGMSLQSFNAALAKHGFTTVPDGSVEAWVSRSFGKTGFCVSLGMVEVSRGATLTTTLCEDSPLVRDIFARVDKMTDVQARALAESAAPKKGKKG